jgi:hypothetical protein
MSLLTSGWLAKPAGSKVRLRRSTIILLVMFFALGALYLQIRTTDGTDQPGPVVIVTPTTVVTETTIATISP